MTFEMLTLEEKGHVSTITLNRPKTLNSFNEQLRIELVDALRRIRRDRTTRALIITGAGRGFCAGADLKEGFVSPSGLDIERMLTEQYNVAIREMRSAPFPIIAAVNGVAAGAGCSIALASDFIIASEEAEFIQIFSRIAMSPDAGSSFFLPRIVGRQRALGMMLTNDPVTAQQAYDWGIAWKLTQASTLMSEAKALAAQLAKQPTRALVMTRRLVDEGATNGLDAQMVMEAAAQGVLSGTDDAREANQAFFEKRKPQFNGN